MQYSVLRASCFIIYMSMAFCIRLPAFVRIAPKLTTNIRCCAYRTIRQRYEYEETIKKSRFIAYADHVDSSDQAKAFIADISQQHPKANHNCWAYNSISGEKCSDDGEPSSTAGRPILNAILHNDLQNVCICVVRYFGGIKLGTGGLTRAYGGTARKCLQQAEIVEEQEAIPLKIVTSIEDASYIQTLCHQHHYTIISQQFQPTTAEFVIHVSSEYPIDDVTNKILSSTQGRAICSHLNKNSAAQKNDF